MKHVAIVQSAPLMNRASILVSLLIAVFSINASAEEAGYIIGGELKRQFNIDSYGQIDLHMKAKSKPVVHLRKFELIQSVAIPSIGVYRRIDIYSGDLFKSKEDGILFIKYSCSRARKADDAFYAIKLKFDEAEKKLSTISHIDRC